MIAERIDSLTPRERDCLRLVLSTDAHKQIGHQLGISTNTVDGYLKSAIRKLGVKSSVRAAQILADYEADGSLPQSWGDHPTALSPVALGGLAALPSTAPPAFDDGWRRRWIRLPARRVGEGGNDLTPAQRLRESVQAAFVAIATIGVIVAALTGLGILAHLVWATLNQAAWRRSGAGEAMLRQSKEVTLRQRAETANQLMAGLKDLENHGDKAISVGTSFMTELLAARSDAQLSPIFGHEALAALAAANAAFVSGLGHIAEAHRHLRDVPGKLGLEPTGWGEVDDSPAAYATPSPMLRAV